MTQHDSPAQDTERLLTVREFSERTRLSERHVRRMLATGQLSPVKLRGVRAIRVREAELRALIS